MYQEGKLCPTRYKCLNVQNIPVRFSCSTVSDLLPYGLQHARLPWSLLKLIAWTIWTFVSKVMSLLLNMLSKFFIAFLPRSKSLLIPWLQSPSAVTFRAQENKVRHCFLVSPSICHIVMGPDAMLLVFWMLRQWNRHMTVLWENSQRTLC